MYFYRQFVKEMEKIRCISSNLYAHTQMQDLLDNHLTTRIGKKRAIANAKIEFDKYYR